MFDTMAQLQLSKKDSKIREIGYFCRPYPVQARPAQFSMYLQTVIWKKTLLYFDLSALTREGRIPTKNFYQFDVSSLGAHLGALKMDREKDQEIL